MSKITAIEKRIKRNIIAKPQTFFIATTPGFNKLCYNELKVLNFLSNQNLANIIKTDIKIEQPTIGGIEFNGYLHDFYYICMNLRTANRILMRLMRFKASNFRTLAKQISSFPWELYIYENCIPSVHVTAKHSRLYHTKAISELVMENIKNRFEKHSGIISFDKKLQSVRIFIRTEDDKFTISIDGSGELLYKRGVKKDTGKAPIRETIAVAALMFANYDPYKPLIDPMCGSGTFSIEAAMITKKIPPGWYRDFAFMSWPCFKETRWVHIRRELEKLIKYKVNSPCIFASDYNEDICMKLKKTISDFTDVINISKRNFFDLNAETIYNKINGHNEKGLIVINPPYGIRMGTKKSCKILFADICNKLIKDFQGWNLLLIVPEKYLLKNIPFKIKILPFTHGGLNLTLATGKIK